MKKLAHNYSVTLIVYAYVFNLHIVYVYIKFQCTALLYLSSDVARYNLINMYVNSEACSEMLDGARSVQIFFVI